VDSDKSYLQKGEEIRTEFVLAMFVLAILATEVVADEVDDLILGLKDEEGAVRENAAYALRRDQRSKGHRSSHCGSQR